MELTNEFDVNLPVDEVWAVLTDLERVAPCLPGARLEQIEGGAYHGVLDARVGPVDAEFEGKVSLVEADEASHRALLSANGSDARGRGDASAAITVQLDPRDDRTHVSVVTDLALSGKVAQFGRGALADAGSAVMDGFVSRLEQTIRTGGASAPDGSEDAGRGRVAEGAEGSIAAAAAAAIGASEPGVRAVSPPARPAETSAPEADRARDAGSSAPLVKRLLPALGALIAVFAFGYLLKRRRGRS
jgi:carbon monoxide dehydrogenase subunit G